jgi:CheY-like chemotaxis protein
MASIGLQLSPTPPNEETAAARHAAEVKEIPGILLVDDDVVSTAARKMILELRFHCRVETAPNALDGLQKMKLSSFDLLITDFHMQPLNGFQFAAVTRTLWPLMPIMMLTGDSSVPPDACSCVDALVLKGNAPEFFLESVAVLLPHMPMKDRN